MFVRLGLRWLFPADYEGLLLSLHWLREMLSSLATAAGLSRPKKKFHFDVQFILEELLNCTFLTGVIFVKIRLRDGGTFSVVSNRWAV